MAVFKQANSISLRLKQDLTILGLPDVTLYFPMPSLPPQDNAQFRYVGIHDSMVTLVWWFLVAIRQMFQSQRKRQSSGAHLVVCVKGLTSPGVCSLVSLVRFFLWRLGRYSRVNIQANPQGHICYRVLRG